jgi:hypothetical protein
MATRQDRQQNARRLDHDETLRLFDEQEEVVKQLSGSTIRIRGMANDGAQEEGWCDLAIVDFTVNTYSTSQDGGRRQTREKCRLTVC